MDVTAKREEQHAQSSTSWPTLGTAPTMSSLFIILHIMMPRSDRGLLGGHSSFNSWCHGWWHFHVIIVLVESHTFFIHLMLQSRWISLAIHTSSIDSCGAVAWWIPFQVMFPNLSSPPATLQTPWVAGRAAKSLTCNRCRFRSSWLVEGSNIPCPFFWFHTSRGRILANLRHLH